MEVPTLTVPAGGGAVLFYTINLSIKILKGKNVWLKTRYKEKKINISPLLYTTYIFSVGHKLCAPCDWNSTPQTGSSPEQQTQDVILL